MKSLGVLLFLLGTSAQGQTTISWNMHMMAELGTLADTATVEHIRCLLGAWRHDTLYVAMAWEPPLVYATPTSLRTKEACPWLLTVGEWHNHVPVPVSMNGEIPTRLPLWSYCELSRVDRLSERLPNPPLLQVIGVRRAVSCAWALTEGKYERMRHWPPKAP